MGVWGVGLSSDDTAADVRDVYRSCRAEGMDGTAATNKVISLFKDSHDDSDDGPPFWLSLAATQFRYGRLEEYVRDRAIKIVDDGTDLARFSATPKLVRARERVLQKLRAQLIGPQHEPVKVRPDVPSECAWEPGEVVGFQCNSGEWIPLHVQGVGESRRSRYPIVSVLDTPFERIDDATEDTPVRRVYQMPLRIRSRISGSAPDRRFGRCPDCFVIFGLKKRDLISDRIVRTTITIQPKVEIKGEGILPGMTCFAWKGFDEFLDEYVEPSGNSR
jgi:hypothetical protein